MNRPSRVPLLLVLAALACSRPAPPPSPRPLHVRDLETGRGLPGAVVVAQGFSDRSIWIFHREPARTSVALLRADSGGFVTLPAEVLVGQYLSVSAWSPGWQFERISHVAPARAQAFHGVESYRVSYDSSAVSTLAIARTDSSPAGSDARQRIDVNQAWGRLGEEPRVIEAGITSEELRRMIAEDVPSPDGDAASGS